MKRPTSSSAPHTTSSMPPIQICDPNAAVPPFGGMPAGKAKIFIVPASMNIAAATIRSALTQLRAERRPLLTRDPVRS